jgi:hypothetical protein
MSFERPSSEHHNASKLLIRGAFLILLFASGALLESFRLASFRDAEIWRNLSVGNWILTHRSWPRAGVFSLNASTAWRDCTWGYDVLSAAAYRLLGLRAIPALLMVFRVAFAVVTFVLAGGTRYFWRSAAFSLVAQFVLAMIGPNPVFFSATLFGVELIALREIQRTGTVRLLYALPLLFLLWANVDTGFIYGLATYGLFLAALVVESHARPTDVNPSEDWCAKIPVRPAAIAGLASAALSLINPYGYFPYITFFQNQRDAISVNLVDHSAMSFHRPEDYLLLLLAMLAFLVLGYRHSHNTFPISLLALSSILAFRAESARWLLVLAALSVLGDYMEERRFREVSSIWDWRWIEVPAFASAIIVSVALFLVVPGSRNAQISRVGQRFPVQACDYIRQHDLPKPLFNQQKWGSFLTWYLPEYPVVIDGRRGLYSEQDESDYSKAMKADIPYQAYPPMRQAQTLLLEKSSLMGEALREVAAFQLVYEDDLAIVLLQQAREGNLSVSR